MFANSRVTAIMSKVFHFVMFCLILCFSVHFVKSEEYGLSDKRDMSDDEEGWTLEDINPDDNKRGDYYDNENDNDDDGDAQS